jgi:hypothetical protein
MLIVFRTMPAMPACGARRTPTKYDGRRVDDNAEDDPGVKAAFRQDT